MRLTRRGALAAFGTASVGSISVVSANGDDSPGAQDVGVEDAVLEHLSNGEPRRAKKLLAENDVEHAMTVHRRGDGGAGGLRPQDSWEKGSAEATVTAFERRGDPGTYLASISWYLTEDEHPTPDTSLPKDAVTMSWQDPWSYEPDSIDVMCEDLDQNETVPIEITNRAVNDQPASSVGARISDSKRYEMMHGHLRAEFTKQNDAEGIIGAQYTHSWAFGGWGAVPGVGFTVGSGPIGLTLEEPLGVDDWTLPDGDNGLVKL